MAGIRRDSQGGWSAAACDVKKETEERGGTGLRRQVEKEWEEQDLGANCLVS